MNASTLPAPAGPAVIGYHGAPSSERVIEAAGVLAARHVIVVVVWEAGVAYDLLAASTWVPAPIDIRTALEVDRAMYESAQRLAEQGACKARDLGFDAEGLAVVDEITVAETLVRVARAQQASALVVGRHGHSPLREALVGSTSRDVIRTAPCPVLITAAPETSKQ